jgi:hypothetical protein
MSAFLECWVGRAGVLATFGDSITRGPNIETAGDRCPNRLAAALGATVNNRGLSGTVLKGSPDAIGTPRAYNGHGRISPRPSDRASRRLRHQRRALHFRARDPWARWVRTRLHENASTAPSGRPRARCHRHWWSTAPIDAGFAVGGEEGFAGQSRHELERHTSAPRSIAAGVGTFYPPVNERRLAEGGDRLILPDHVHPNAEGHAEIAEIFAAAKQL